MKIPQIILAGLLVTQFLTGCAPRQEPAYTSETTEALTTLETTEITTALTVVPDSPIQTPIGGIGEKSDRYDVTVGETKLMSVSLTLPVASITGNEELQAMLTERLALIEGEIDSYIEGLRVKYEADHAAGREGLAIPSIRVRFELNYFTANAASLTYFYNETTAEGRTIDYSRFCNIDLRAGSEILLSALLNDGTSDKLAGMVSEAVAATETDGLYSGQQSLIADLLDERWYLTRNSIDFRFSAGELAPVSSGEITVSLNKQALADLLSSYGSALIED